MSSGLKKEPPLQALILADSFTSTCRPISLETPKVLFPLCNAPMLAYVLEFLEASGVKEAFVFCSSFADEVETFIAKSKFGSGIGDMSVRVVKVWFHPVSLFQNNRHIAVLYKIIFSPFLFHILIHCFSFSFSLSPPPPPSLKLTHD
jgi:hypothetical protein